jgi:membrane-associated phospholipid phosphatase
MALLNIRLTRIDEEMANAVASHTDRRIERCAKVLTWGADEHVLLALAALGWIFTRTASEPRRRFGDHVLACTLVTAVLPHIMKRLINQERPDRRTIEGHLRGIPLSGKSDDAFPSGHAMHVGALVSAATLLPTKLRNVAWALGTVLVTTRVVVLAHWFTDVLAGLALGASVERVIRLWTKPNPL